MSKALMDSVQIQECLDRLAQAIVEAHGLDTKLFLVGILKGGVPLAERLEGLLQQKGAKQVQVGHLDISFYRDDVHHREDQVAPNLSSLGSLEDELVILCDDVLQGGRTIRAALNAVMDYGRPQKIELCVLIDRGQRQVPICPTYWGVKLDIPETHKIKVKLKNHFKQDEVVAE